MENFNTENRLFIGGISARSTTPELNDYFVKFGAIKDIKLKRNTQNGRCLGYAYLEVTSKETYEKILSHPSHKLGGR